MEAVAETYGLLPSRLGPHRQKFGGFMIHPCALNGHDRLFGAIRSRPDFFETYRSPLLLCWLGGIA